MLTSKFKKASKNRKSVTKNKNVCKCWI